MRFGLGWRAELGAGIVAHLDRIDVLEVLAEELFDATREQKRALRFLRSHVPIVVHGTSLGLASTERVDRKRLDAIARVIDWLEPELWSEHLAFVRAGGREVGHLAAPPRNDDTLAGLARNVEDARRVTGSLPLLENVASLIEPPLCTYDEQSWLHAVLASTECDLLLDLHNVHANACNFGFIARDVVASLPADRVRAIHLAGGRRIERGRVLDDHLHDVPDEVFALLPYVQTRDAMVILERDGNYPAIEVLLADLEKARGAASAAPMVPAGVQTQRRDGAESAGGTPALRQLALLYTDDETRERFLADPAAVAPQLADVDKDDLRLAARSFAMKRAKAARCRESPSRNPSPETSQR
jgi:uncharacterized protein (UPF0276 family)